MTGDFSLSNCVVCNCPNLNLHTSSSSHSSLNEERNLFRILCTSLDLDGRAKGNKKSSNESSSSLFCSECKVAIVTLNVIQEQIDSLQEKKRKLISKMISCLIVSSPYQYQYSNPNQSITIKKETGADSTLHDNTEAESLRKQICGRFCPIVNLKQLRLDHKLPLNQKSSEEDVNLNFVDDGENYEDSISNVFEDCLTDEDVNERVENNTLDNSPAHSKGNESESEFDGDSETNSDSGSDWDPRSSPPLASSSSSLLIKRQGIKRKHPTSKSKTKSTSNLSNGSTNVKMNKDKKFGLFQTVVDNLGDGKFMYRDYFPFESVPGTCGFKCGSCHRIAKNIRSIRFHLHSVHYRNSEHYVPDEKDKDKDSSKRNEDDEGKAVENSNSNPNPRIGIRPLTTLELGPGKFITNGQWIFNEVPQPQQFDEDGQQLQQQEPDQEGQQLDNSIPTPIYYECETCNKIMAHKKRMVTHIREIHFRKHKSD